MEPAAKRARLSYILASFLKPFFLENSKWCLVYLHVALGCNIPILEAILWTSYTVTGFTEEIGGVEFFTAIKEFLADRISLLRSDWCPDCYYPNSNYWHPTTQSNTGKDGINFWIKASLGRLELQNIDNRVGRSNAFLWIGFDVEVDYVQHYVKIHIRRPDFQFGPQHIPWGKFIPILEEEVERFRPDSDK
jgi:hypothetical protein